MGTCTTCCKRHMSSEGATTPRKAIYELLRLCAGMEEVANHCCSSTDFVAGMQDKEAELGWNR